MNAVTNAWETLMRSSAQGWADSPSMREPATQA
jgi:hypothetical protein